MAIAFAIIEHLEDNRALGVFANYLRACEFEDDWCVAHEAPRHHSKEDCYQCYSQHAVMRVYEAARNLGRGDEHGN